jgi:hypothetical protein
LEAPIIDTRIGVLTPLRRVSAEHVGRLARVHGVVEVPAGVGEVGRAFRGWQVAVPAREIELDLPIRQCRSRP